MTNLAIRECNKRNLLPERYRRLLDDREKLDAAIAEQQPREVTRGKRTLNINQD